MGRDAKDYSKACIYIITTKGGCYVGSTNNFNRRKIEHRRSIYNSKCRNYNSLICQKIRENNGEWCMQNFKNFPCNNKKELEDEERKWINELNSTCNKNMKV